MFFLQVLIGTSFLLEALVTLSPYLKMMFFVVGFIVMGFITLASGFYYYS